MFLSLCTPASSPAEIETGIVGLSGASSHPAKRARRLLHTLAVIL
ncbi:hypothetical protein PAMC26510_17070 [Caballeronia sordidicola]|uniref:Uncharacterized protein n=1 Tax=Caballeronia sordidicola TaxID=196367 RepID=A0A242N581_CABSO|nr:hypothetical protein PAMC26510_17070 [Caballeronia sordidicola]OTP78818.1 hypothetical protein PAMC26577_04265 [Caballeronia sordidicola]